MGKITKDEIITFIEPNIKLFHETRIEKLVKLKLKEVLQRKNPYLFKAKNTNTAHDLIKTLLDAYLSSQEEGIFGGFLEELSIYICNKVYGGHKSTAEGIDLEFERDNIKYIVSIKSGPNWGNSQQIARMKENFTKAKRILGTNSPRREIVAVCGCCYGKEKNENKGEYLKLCGQVFWEFISGDEKLYLDIIEPLGHKAKEKNENFVYEYGKVINKFTRDFSIEFCDSEGRILWEKLVAFNSEKFLRRTNN